MLILASSGYDMHIFCGLCLRSSTRKDEGNAETAENQTQLSQGDDIVVCHEEGDSTECSEYHPEQESRQSNFAGKKPVKSQEDAKDQVTQAKEPGTGRVSSRTLCKRARFPHTWNFHLRPSPITAIQLGDRLPEMKYSINHPISLRITCDVTH